MSPPSGDIVYRVYPSYEDSPSHSPDLDIKAKNFRFGVNESG